MARNVHKHVQQLEDVETQRDLDMSHADMKKRGYREPPPFHALDRCPGEKIGPQRRGYPTPTARDFKKAP